MTAPVEALHPPLAFKFTLPIRTVSLLNVREHWAVKARRNKAQRAAVALMFPRRAKGLLSSGEWPRCTVTLTRIAPRGLDVGDNLGAATKGIRDQLAHELGVDDRSPRYCFVYAQRKGAVREYGVEVFLERVDL